MSSFKYPKTSPWLPAKGVSYEGSGLPHGLKNNGPRGVLFYVLMGLLTLAIIGGGFGIYYFVYTPKVNVGLEFAKPDQVLLGEPFAVTVAYSNYSEQVLKNAKVSLSLPPGISFVGQSQDKRVSEHAIGDIGPNGTNRETFNLIALADPQSVKHLDAALTYQIGLASPAEFKNSSGADITIGQPAITLSFKTPNNIFNGENFEIGVTNHNNSAQDFQNLHMKIEYPNTFNFLKSTLAPALGTTDWNFGTLHSGETKNMTVTGNIVGAEGSFFAFNVTLTADFMGQTYTIYTQPTSIAIAIPPLSLTITANGNPNYISRAGDTISYSFIFKNNSTDVLRDIIVKATLTGEMFKFGALTSRGSFNSITNTVTWNVAAVPDLVELQPGESGRVEVSIPLKDQFPISRLSDKNYKVKVAAHIESPTIPAGVTAQKTVSTAQLENKIAGTLKVQALGYFYDAASGIVNAGPYPPKVHQPTQYTIHWRISSYATDVQNVRLSTFIQSGGRFTGAVKSTTDTVPQYNPLTGEVTWTIPSIPANRGVINPPAEAIFQVEATPAVNQVGQNVTLINDTNYQAYDVFTERDISGTVSQINSSLPDDKSITVSNNHVQP